MLKIKCPKCDGELALNPRNDKELICNKCGNTFY